MGIRSFLIFAMSLFCGTEIFADSVALSLSSRGNEADKSGDLWSVDRKQVMPDAESEDEKDNLTIAKITISEKPIAEVLTFTDINGDIYTPTFDQLPYYLAQIQIGIRGENDQEYTTFFPFLAAWPSNYIHNQRFDKDGLLIETDDVSEAERDYKPVSLSDISNSGHLIHTFKATSELPDLDNGDRYWSLLLSPIYNLDEECIVDGNTHSFTRDVPSKINLMEYDEESGKLVLDFLIYTTDCNTLAKNVVKGHYEGNAIVTCGNIPEFEESGITQINQNQYGNVADCRGNRVGSVYYTIDGRIELNPERGKLYLQSKDGRISKIIF